MIDDEHSQYQLVCPFWVDTDAYSERDQFMFAAGAEFANVLGHARFEDEAFSGTIHRENESRIRMMCGRLGRRCTITACDIEDDPGGHWSYLEIEPR